MVAPGMLLTQRHLGAKPAFKRAALHVAAYKQDHKTVRNSSKTSQQQVGACRLQQGWSNCPPSRHTAACRVAVQVQLEPNRVLKASLGSILHTYYGEACTSMHPAPSAAHNSNSLSHAAVCPA